MVSEQHVLVRGIEIRAVVQPMGGRHALVVQLEHLGGQEPSIEAECQDIEAGGGDHQPQPVHPFPRLEDPGDEPERDGADGRHQRPHDHQPGFHARYPNKAMELCK